MKWSTMFTCTYYLFQKKPPTTSECDKTWPWDVVFPMNWCNGTSGQRREVVEWYLGKGSPDLVDVSFGDTVARFLLLISRKKDMTILILMMISGCHDNLFSTPHKCNSPFSAIAGLTSCFFFGTTMGLITQIRPNKSGCFRKSRYCTPKWMVENNGKPYLFMDDFGG